MKIYYKSGVCHIYAGRYSKYQLYGNKKETELPLDDRQNFLYQKALHGLRAYTPEQIKEMTPKKRDKVIKEHKRSQKILNLWKQKIVNVKAANLFISLFPKNPITKLMTETVNDTNPDYFNKISFKDLKVTRKDVITVLIAEKVLPSNFYNLKTDNHASRIAIKRWSADDTVTGDRCGERSSQATGEAGQRAHINARHCSLT